VTTLGFTPISIDEYVELHVKHNPHDPPRLRPDPKQFRQNSQNLCLTYLSGLADAYGPQPESNPLLIRLRGHAAIDSRCKRLVPRPIAAPLRSGGDEIKP